MKKYSLLFACMVLSFAAMAQKAVIVFDEKVHDFGKVNEEGGKITWVFDFVNKGNSPLVVNRVQTTCGCTTPVWTKEPIEPGKKGSITVTYNPLGRPNSFSKPITVYSNATDEQVVLTIRGEVIPRASNDNSAFPVRVGGLKAKLKVIQMNNVEKGRNQTRSLAIQNTSKEPIKPTVENLPSYISYSVSPAILNPNDEGTITFVFNSKYCPQWGPVSEDVYLNCGSSKVYNEDNKLTIIANVIEDFGRMTLDQRRKAPIFEVPQRTLDMGTLRKGSKRIGKFRICNKGQGSLEVRRIINNNKELAVRSTKSSVAGGRYADIIVDLHSRNLTEGEYKKTFTVQTNDPDNSFVMFVLSWKVQ